MPTEVVVGFEKEQGLIVTAPAPASYQIRGVNMLAAVRRPHHEDVSRKSDPLTTSTSGTLVALCTHRSSRQLPLYEGVSGTGENSNDHRGLARVTKSWNREGGRQGRFKETPPKV